jgi:hypothetical protein
MRPPRTATNHPTCPPPPSDHPAATPRAMCKWNRLAVALVHAHAPSRAHAPVRSNDHEAHVVVLGALLRGGRVAKGCEVELHRAALEREAGIDTRRVVERDLEGGALAEGVNPEGAAHELLKLLLLVGELDAA